MTPRLRLYAGHCARCRAHYGGTVAGRLVALAWAGSRADATYTETRHPPAGWFPASGECYLCWVIPSYAWLDQDGEECSF